MEKQQKSTTERSRALKRLDAHLKSPITDGNQGKESCSTCHARERMAFAITVVRE